MTENSTSVTRATRPDEDWWSALGLAHKAGQARGRRDPDQSETTQAFLRSLRPTAFEQVDELGQTVAFSLEEAAARVAKLDAAQAAAEQRELEAWTEQRQQHFQAQFEGAYAGPLAELPVGTGGWAGFTYADAVAWSWNLFQFEPRGIAHPGSQARVEAMRALERGELPEVFGYAERARTLADRGLTPRSYRERRVALKSDPLR